MITESAILKAVGYLNAINQPGWIDVSYELQDDGQFLLITIKTASEKLILGASLRETILSEIQQQIPPKLNGEYSWMIVFAHEGRVYDSLMSSLEIK